MSQERITTTDREAMAFIARFPGADTEAVAQALIANPSRFDSDDTERSIHPTQNVVSRRLAKLARLGCVQSWRSPAALVTHHGILEGGMDALELFGQAPGLERGISQKRGLALMHGRDIANVAAQLMYGEYADPRVTALIGSSVPVDAFITDQAMHSALATLRKQDSGFTLYQHVQQTLAQTHSDELKDIEFWHSSPELLVFTGSAGLDTKHRTHRPDLMVFTEKGYRIAFEVERSAKSVASYIDTLRLFRATLLGYDTADKKKVAPVQGLIWLCTSDTIKNAVTRAANMVDPNLIKEGWVIVTNLTRANGEPLTYGEAAPPKPRTATRPEKATASTRPPKVSTSHTATSAPSA